MARVTVISILLIVVGVTHISSSKSQLSRCRGAPAAPVEYSDGRGSIEVAHSYIVIVIG